MTFPPNTCPLPRKVIANTPALFGYGGQMSAMVIFGGHVSSEGANAQHALRIHAVTIAAEVMSNYLTTDELKNFSILPEAP